MEKVENMENNNPKMNNYNQPVQPQQQPPMNQIPPNQGTKFCKFCGAQIPFDAVICTHCGRQVENINNGQPQGQPTIVVNNTSASYSNANATANNTMGGGRQKNKWVAFFLCLFLGYFGAHKFYEGKVGMGILYLFTFGLFGIGWVVDIFIIAFKPNPYYV